jgi:hypothetical protein
LQRRYRIFSKAMEKAPARPTMATTACLNAA